MQRNATPHHILVIRTDRLGETVLHLPLLAALQQSHPHAAITWMVQQDFVELFQGIAGVTVIPYGEPNGGSWWHRAWRLAWRLRQGRYDAVLISNPKKEFHLAVWLAGIPCRVGYDRKWGVLLTHRIADLKAHAERHEVQWHMELLKALGQPIDAPVWRPLPLQPFAVHSIATLLKREGLPVAARCVAVHPWTSNPRKQWPLERFRALIRELLQEPDVWVILIGGSQEAAHAHAVMSSESSRCLNLIGRLSLPQLAAALARMDVLVSNDSGPVHVAAAVGVPTVVLFGTLDSGSRPSRWGPWGQGHHVFAQPTLEAITVEEVARAVAQVLQQRETPRVPMPARPLA